MRRIYIALLGLHPRAFRERFSEEMIGIFDEESKSGRPLRLLADAGASVLRQRAFRAPRASPATACVVGIPMFQTVEHHPLSFSVLIPGAAMTLLSFATLSFAVGRGGGHLPGFLIGAKTPRAASLSFDRSSIAVADASTNVRVKPAYSDPEDQIVKVYFNAIRALKALDVNKDHVLSEIEITAAPSTLAGLDRNGDGELDAEECGFFVGMHPRSGLEVALIEDARGDFMRANPVLAVLDTDHDGRLNAYEIQAATTSLWALDRNRDGRLAPTEVLPHAAGSDIPRTRFRFPGLDRWR